MSITETEDCKDVKGLRDGNWIGLFRYEEVWSVTKLSVLNKDTVVIIESR